MKGFIKAYMAQDRRNLSAPLKHRLIEQWTLRRLGKIDHERRVAAIASTLFDLTHSHHKLELSDRRLLDLACVLHDVGRKVDDNDHPAIGAKMILDDSWMPLSDAERRAITYLTRYHRGAVPEIGYDEVLSSTDNRRRLRMVLALLRAADALDGRQIAPPRLVFAMRGRKLSVTVYLESDSPKVRRFFKRRKKFRLLEELLHCRVDITVEHADAVHTVN